MRSRETGPAGSGATVGSTPPRTTWFVGLVLVVAVAATAAAPTAAPPPDERVVDVIVSAGAGGQAGAEAAVERLGGVVTAPLDIVDGVAATVPVSRLDALRSAPGVEQVSPDAPVHVQGQLDSEGVVRSVYPGTTGARSLLDDGVTGAGVTVALIDTGVADVPDVAGRVRPVTDRLTGGTTPCVDLSGEGHCGDSYGHGTFMAGIILGNGASSAGAYVGMAPEAQLVSLKVAGRDGSSDVSKVLTAIQWAVANRDRHGIRVINLSLGTDSTQSWTVDPFNYAVERAWDAGIVVVVAASNFGPARGTIAKPGDDPWVVTVGAVDDRGTTPGGDDRLPDFSSRGPTADGVTKPDVVAPGAHLVSLDAPGSAIAERFPTLDGGAYRRGSGTSMAAAAVTGGVALLLDQHPGWTPDQVKGALRSTARRTASSDPLAVGAGAVDLAAAAASDGPPSTVGLGHSSGRGRLDLSRGRVRAKARDPLGTVLDGSLTAQLLLWDPIGFTTGDWDSETSGASTVALSGWYATSWHGNNWQGNNWQGNNWQGNNWQGDWEGATAADGSRFADTYGAPWLGAAWLGLWE